MNSKYAEFEMNPPVKAMPWNKVFLNTDPTGIDLVSKLLVFDKRYTVIEALTHDFFDELRVEGATLSNGHPFPDLCNFTEEELIKVSDHEKPLLIPEWARKLMTKDRDGVNEEAE